MERCAIFLAKILSAAGMWDNYMLFGAARKLYFLPLGYLGRKK